MAGVRDIKRRIRSVKSTQQIISAMKINIISVVVVRTRDGRANLILRLKTDDTDEVRHKLEELNYKFID